MRPHLVRKIRIAGRLTWSALRSLGKQKVFCVGRNKTGTTSLAAAFADLGLIVGNQTAAEKLVGDWAIRDFRRLRWYCRTAQAFQDVPFSLPYTFQALDLFFPGSKFILTVRDSPEQWYESLVRYLARLTGSEGAPSADALKAAPGTIKERLYQANRFLYTTPEHDLFHKKTLLAHYSAHIEAVTEYFRHRPGDLLVLNAAEPGAFDKLCDFLGKKRTGKPFPWENKTA